jgi:exonuclease SbcC
VLGQTKSALQQYNQALGAQQQEKTLHDAIRTQLKDDLATSQFATEDAVLRAFRSPTEIQALEYHIQSHDSQERKLRETLEDLSSDRLPNDCPDVAQLQQIAEQAKSKAREARDRVTRADMYCKNAQSHLRKAEELDAEAKKSRDAADLVSRVFQTCDGKGKGLGQSRISLETWVLTAELERVTAAASERLLRMTAGRYRLQRTETAASGNKQAGLDLEVFDSHTGRTRATGTLSGGEQFQASLALALGLADVVSHGGTGSGNVYGTLFIDEGFGSLDPEALEQVIDTLDTLRDGGRMVGVITHVEAMKQALPIGIEVLRRPDGRGSTLRK